MLLETHTPQTTYLEKHPIMLSVSSLPRVLIIPGNGCSPVHSANWYAYMETQLNASGRFSQVILRDMPDPNQAKEAVWLPFIRSELKIDENTIIVGHSSGAVASLRLLETSKLLGCVLVAACYTDLGDAGERQSGYYSRPWNWSGIKSNARWILQYHSKDDPFIPAAEADHIAAHIGSEYKLYSDKSHFFGAGDVQDIVQDIIAKVL